MRFGSSPRPRGRRRRSEVFLVLLSLTIVAGCEELGPDARGEIQNSATQRVGVQRMCLPFLDVANVQRSNVQGNAEHLLEFALRDGTRWVNPLTSPDPASASQSACELGQGRPSLLFDSDPDEICAEDVVLVGVRTHQLARFLGRCRLGEFRRL